MGHHRVRAGRGLAIATALALVGSVAIVGSAGAQTAVQGVTDKSVKLGFISAETGVAASTGNGAGEACKGRIDRANAEGGVNGRKIELVAVDDQSSPTNLDKAKDLVENRQVFALVNDSALAFFSNRYLAGTGIPVIGGGFDGSYYYDPGYENFFSGLGKGAPVPGLTYDTGTRLMKKLGAKKLATVGYGISASSSENAKAVYDYAAPATGLDAVYLNTSVDFGSTDVGPVVLGIKNSGADAVYMPLNSSTNLAIVQGLQQNGVRMKANVMATGYGQELLDSPIAAALTPADVFQTGFRPIELGGKGVKQFMKDRKKYTTLTGVPDWGEYTGYVTCDMFVTGLELAGKDLTRQSFVDGLRTLDDYDGAGLACSPYDFTLENYAKVAATSCQWYVTVKDGKFVVENKGKPVVGKLVGKPALIAQYGPGGSGAATTTTVAG
ncbi:MAG: ABC transporter substrate-binding protein [Actinomycetota bacterium]